MSYRNVFLFRFSSRSMSDLFMYSCLSVCSLNLLPRLFTLFEELLSSNLSNLFGVQPILLFIPLMLASLMKSSFLGVTFLTMLVSSTVTLSTRRSSLVDSPSSWSVLLFDELLFELDLVIGKELVRTKVSFALPAPSLLFFAFSRLLFVVRNTS